MKTLKYLSDTDKVTICCFDSPKEALLCIISYFVEGKFYGSKFTSGYIWEKDGKFYTESEDKYTSKKVWEKEGYNVYDVVKMKSYTRTFKSQRPDETLTGFMFNKEKYYNLA